MKWENRGFQHEKPESISGLISIILPTYNRINFLKTRIDEIFNQSYTNWELIIVNDNSNDSTNSFLETIKHSKIKIINLFENSGCVSLPRNIGISFAKGEFISPTDDDVIIDKNKLNNLINSIGDNILCYGKRIDYNILTKNKSNPNFITKWNPLNDHGIDNGQFIYRKSCYENMPYVISTHACDLHLAKYLYKLGNFHSINENVCTYLWHENNRSHQESRKYKKIYPLDYKKYFNVLNDIAVIYEL